MSNFSLQFALTLPSGGRLQVAKIAQIAPPSDDSAHLATAGSEKRARERAAWHALARTMLADHDAEFEYNAIGAPQIVDSQLYISVSHSATHVAVLISPCPCAVDIESCDRNFDRIASRYIAPSEALLHGQKELLQQQLWSIKETAYKYAARKGLNLRDDIIVTELTENQFVATVKPSPSRIVGTITQVDNHTLAFIG